MTQKFENLDIWQKSKNLAIKVYEITTKYPSREQFAITSQTNRAAISISSNIAEGSSRTSKRDFNHFLTIAIGSAFELENLIIIARELEYLSEEAKCKIICEIVTIEKMINGLKRRLDE